jgi:hypothetical protein
VAATEYVDQLRLVKALLIVASLQKRTDLKARKAIQEFRGKLKWKPFTRLMIDSDVWKYAVAKQRYEPKFVFCHPDILLQAPVASLYYRGLCGLSLKAVRDYFGAVENIEKGSRRARLDRSKAIKMAQTYNTFICSIIKNSTDWTLENGHRAIIATLGISLDGSMRNKVGEVAEQRIRTMIMEWVIGKGLLVAPSLTKDDIQDRLPASCTLQNGITMRFSSDPDIEFSRHTTSERELLAVVEIKGGIDPAGALERYGAATKSFQHATKTSPRCKNFFLSAVFTDELVRRIRSDRLVEKHYDIIKLLEDDTTRTDFFDELFHHALRF